MPDDRPTDVPPVEESLAQLHCAGWSRGDTALATEGGGLVWVVSGSNDENLIRSRGADVRRRLASRRGAGPGAREADGMLIADAWGLGVVARGAVSCRATEACSKRPRSR